jgi:hypothetical protein
MRRSFALRGYAVSRSAHVEEALARLAFSDVSRRAGRAVRDLTLFLAGMALEDGVRPAAVLAPPRFCGVAELFTTSLRFALEGARSARS